MSNENKKGRAAIIIMLTVSLLWSAGNSIGLYRLSRPAESSSQEDEIPALAELDYFKRHDVSLDTAGQLFNLSDGEYLLYFYAPDCTACQKAGQDMAAFIYYGLTDLIDIYFVDVSRNESLTGDTEPASIDAETFKVVYTPTLLHLTPGQPAEYFTGADQVYQVLDGIVAAAREKQ